MSTLIITRSHDLPRELVAERLDALAAELSERAEILPLRASGVARFPPGVCLQWAVEESNL